MYVPCLVYNLSSLSLSLSLLLSPSYEDYPSKKTPTDTTSGDGVNGSDETVHNDPNQDDGAAAKRE